MFESQRDARRAALDAATVIAREAYAKAHSLKALGRLVAWAVVGVEPKVMGIGPAPAARKALLKADMKLEQMDRVEVNEAFAPQYLPSRRSWDSTAPRPMSTAGRSRSAIRSRRAAPGSRFICSMPYVAPARATVSAPPASAAARLAASKPTRPEEGIWVT